MHRSLSELEAKQTSRQRSGSQAVFVCFRSLLRSLDIDSRTAYGLRLRVEPYSHNRASRCLVGSSRQSATDADGVRVFHAYCTRSHCLRRCESHISDAALPGLLAAGLKCSADALEHADQKSEVRTCQCSGLWWWPVRIPSDVAPFRKAEMEQSYQAIKSLWPAHWVSLFFAHHP